MRLFALTADYFEPLCLIVQIPGRKWSCLFSLLCRDASGESLRTSDLNNWYNTIGEIMETVIDFIFLCSKITVGDDCSHEIKRCLFLERKAMTNLDSIIKSRDITLPAKVHTVKAMVSPVVVYGCESWTLKKAEHCTKELMLSMWCWRRLLDSSLYSKEIKPVNPKWNQSWIFIGRTDTEAEAPILWPPDAKNWLIGKDLDAGKDWRQEEKRATEDEMVGWHHWLSGHEFEHAPGAGDG